MDSEIRGSEGGKQTWSDYYEEDLSLPLVYRHLVNVEPFIRKCQAYCDGKRLLEIGTGTGMVAVDLSQQGYDVVGVDYDGRILERNQRLNRRFMGRARSVHADMFGLPFGPNSFDLCYHQGLMEHFDAPMIMTALRAQAQVARRVLFAVPTKRWKGGLFGDERLWAGKEWRNLLEEFRVLDVFGGAYSSYLTRTLNFIGKRVSRERPKWLYRRMAQSWAGEVGFVIEQR